ncbi:hypothetical protein GCM10007385_03140 [Tateyamaria omphalii]|uniref:hypothetical protein n=1 Tax=Tateyamaria omphalii TaxID=299262 RepID=UPI00167368A8|nr:hypothetical protein [Tateyamaria omphalii]GGX39479.1 hypothetical protein GCM10007385_03140 [Tateyamaria omphalii]
MAFDDPLVQQLVAFVESIGLKVRAEDMPDGTFLPGLDVRGGALCIDTGRLAYPGDILHEAGHMAVADEDRRMQPDFKPTKAEEMAAMAWSYAAIRHLGLPPETVFHGDGYQGGSGNLVDAFEQGNGPGVPVLAWLELTTDPNGLDTQGKRCFPKMDRWVR